MARKHSSCTAARAVAATAPADTTAAAAPPAVSVTSTGAKFKPYYWLFLFGSVFLLLLLTQQQPAAALPFPNRKSSNTLKTPDASLKSVSETETAATAAKTAAAAAPFLSTVSTDRDLHEHDHQQEQQDQEQEQQLVPADASLSLLSSTAETTSTSGSPQYLCMNARSGGPCENRYDTTVDKRHLHCPQNECCSRTKCVSGRCSAFCSNAWALCSTWLIRFEHYSYGKCNCGNFGSKCPANSHCVEDTRPLKGPYCECNQGYIRDNDRCIPNPCNSVRCHPGACMLQGLEPKCNCPEGYESTGSGAQVSCGVKSMCTNDPCGAPGTFTMCSTTGPLKYVCTCAHGYELHEDPQTKKQTCVKEKITCSKHPCGVEGVESCTDTDDGYKCACRSGYRLVEDSSSKKCEFINACDQNVCGPPAAVLSCSVNSGSHICQCQNGYSLRPSSQNSEIMYCQPDHRVTNAEAPKEEENQSTYMMAGLGLGALALVGALGFAYTRRKSAASEGDEETAEENPVEEHATTVVTTGPAPPEQHAITPAPGSWA